MSDDFDEQDFWEFYVEVLSELGMEHEIYRSGDEENIFQECFKSCFGYWPKGDDILDD